MAEAPRPQSIELVALDGGRATSLAVRAQPGSRRPGVLGVWNACLKLGVAEPAEDGRANASLTRLLCRLFDLPRAKVALIGGATSRQKTFRLDAPPAAVRERLTELLQD